ncbi:hypothetical protein HMPREF1434_00629 [Helicobacter pylori GAMchJs124i]|nr:hypothetical protein HMPREF1434_00629 [Helicobacter pylori GAMchJs124i]
MDLATAPVVPVPKKGSKIISLGLVALKMIFLKVLLVFAWNALFYLARLLAFRYPCK